MRWQIKRFCLDFFDVSVHGSNRAPKLFGDSTHSQALGAKLGYFCTLLVGAREIVLARFTRPADDGRGR